MKEAHVKYIYARGAVEQRKGLYGEYCLSFTERQSWPMLYLSAYLETCLDIVLNTETRPSLASHHFPGAQHVVYGNIFLAWLRTTAEGQNPLTLQHWTL